MTYNPQGFSETIFKDRYAFTDKETWEEACERIAQQIAKAESPDKQGKYFEKFKDVLVNNYFVPGGRIWYNSGRNNAQLLNCFVLTNQLDSKQGWGDIAKEMVVTSMTGGGCGIDYSDVRPRGAKINSQRGECPGPVELMKLVNGCAKPIRAGGQRRVALMFSLDLDHPDIEEFLDAKLKQGELEYANISVRSKRTKDFLKAVEEDGKWQLSWKGQYKKEISAKRLWNKIVKNAYNSAEPGFLNWELALSESTIWNIEELVTTNPCGEICLSSYDCCCLGHLVLPRFLDEKGNLDWHFVAETVRTGIRMLDNVLTVNTYPMNEMQEKSHKLRRVGMGVTGLADLLALLGYKYGSEDGNKFVDKLFRFISKVAYESSVMLAIEKGPFPACDPEKFLQSGFVKRMPNKIKALIKEHGIRNCALLTLAPTGTVSILSGNCSSGIEPMFSPAYERNYWDKEERKMELVFHPLFAKFMDEEKDVSHFVGTSDLTVRDHMEVQKVIQKHIDNAVSKTVNVPEKYPLKDVEKLWKEYLPHLKGTTFYRENTRGYINEAGEKEEPPLKAISLKEAIKRYEKTAKQESKSNDECPGGKCDI
jgi:ribonucleoside-diphosphate reductase alpha chain